MRKKSANEDAHYLLTMISEIGKIPSVQNAPVIVNELAHAKSLLEDTLFKIAVVGEFSSGKSTFINALLGKDILSHAKNETTAAITHIYNVPEHDPRCGTCEIMFSDGNRQTLPDFTDLSKYTTVQNGDKVAETVKLVTLYCHFLSTDHPILIIDTPGLNGTAKGHRELTLNEIQNAHTCFYLLSRDGVKQSDTEFLSLLVHYQSSILFLQNFVDDLKKSEGDTVENKVERARRDIENVILPIQPKLKAHYIGISALNALVSCDLSIEKQYQDSEPLTSADRERLYQESNFTELKNYITDLIHSGEYRSVIVQTVIQRCLTLMEEFLSDMDLRQKLLHQSESEDPEKVRLALAKEAKKQISETREDRVKRLKNYIIGKSDSFRRTVLQQLTEELKQLLETIRQRVAEEIPNYAALRSFEARHENKTPPAFFAEQVNAQLKSDAGVYTDIWNLTRKMIQYLYDLAMERVSEYIMVQFKASADPISLPKLDSTFQMDPNMEISHHAQIEYYKGKIAELKLLITDLRSEIIQMQTKCSRISNQISQCETEIRNAEQDYASQKHILGSKPGPDYIRKSKLVAVPRKFLFWNLDPRMETHYYTEEDYTKQQAWCRKAAEIDRQWDKKKSELRRKLSELYSAKEDVDEDIRNAEQRIADKQKQIRQKEEEHKQAEELYKKKEAMEKERNCTKYKERLLQAIESKLTEEDEQTAYSYMAVRVESVFQKETPKIENEIVRIYNQNVDSKLKDIDEFIKTASSELAVRYESCDADIEQMNTLRNALCKYFEIE